MSNLSPTPESPPWGSTTKMIVGLTMVAIVAALLIQFRGFIGPLILAFMLAYLLHPVAAHLGATFKISWRFAVNLIYIFLVILLAGFFTVTGLAVAQQLQSLIGFFQRFVTQDLPALVENLSSRVFVFGPFTLNLSQFDLQSLTDQLLAAIQPILGRAGGLISSFATSAVGFLGLSFFVLLISYFLLADAGQVSNRLMRIDVPGYNADILRLIRELQKIWNSFLRGQLIISLLVIIIYSFVFFVLGLRYSFGLAILAGLARFFPYIGPLFTLSISSLVAFFQASNYLGLQPLTYTLMIVVISLLIDQIFDNVVTPRFLGNTLGVHPAAVLVAAIIAANLIGLIGLILAAPVLASLTLIGRYILRKMFDLAPWPEEEEVAVGPVDLPWMRAVRRFRAWWRMQQRGGS